MLVSAGDSLGLILFYRASPLNRVTPWPSGFRDDHVSHAARRGLLTQAKPKPRPPSHYLWVALIARIFEVFPLICPHCFGPMRIIAFVTFSADIDKILEHIGVDSVAPRITPARGPPLWDECGAQEPGEGVDAMPDWDMTSRSAPDYPEDQRTVW